jgi:hypothetical protein
MPTQTHIADASLNPRRKERLLAGAVIDYVPHFHLDNVVRCLVPPGDVGDLQGTAHGLR